MKHIFFAFRGDPMCFVHVLLNSLDLNEKGIAQSMECTGI